MQIATFGKSEYSHQARKCSICTFSYFLIFALVTHFHIGWLFSRTLISMTKATLDTVQYPVMEAFYTLQGEGFHQGKAAYFVRLGGCDVGCVWCDVKESWDAAMHPQLS